LRTDPDSGRPVYKFLEPRDQSALDVWGLSNRLAPILAAAPALLGLLMGRSLQLREALWSLLPSLGALGLTTLLARPGNEGRAPTPQEAKAHDILLEIARLGLLVGAWGNSNGLLQRLAATAAAYPDRIKEALDTLYGFLRTGEEKPVAAPEDVLKPPVVPPPVDENDPVLRKAASDKEKAEAEQRSGESGTKVMKDKDSRIYVHSKLLIVDQAYAMIGSANHNERSMWHDTEDMLGIRDFSTSGFISQMRQRQFSTVLGDNVPDKDAPAEEIYERFQDMAKKNQAALKNHHNMTNGFLLAFTPRARWGITAIS
jgi:phosphatidylserine/phosphatidylglycerophosphate/cardiolipin synthase-like enzyme